MTTKTLLHRVARNTLVRNTSWQLGAEGGRLLIQGIAFVLISRALGPAGIGAFAGAVALVFLLVPFAGWGSAHVLIMHVARKPASFPTYWGNALLIILACGSLLTLVTVALAVLFVPTLPLGLVLTIAVAEFFFGKLSDTSAQAFRAFERMSGAAQQMMVEGVFRLIATVIFIATTPEPTAQGWAAWYLGATVLESLVGFARIWRHYGPPRPAPALIWNSLNDGWLFSVNQASASVYNNMDKTMLAELGTLEATGIYATAYRIIDMAFIPVKSLVFASYPRFFKAGATGISGSLALARRLLPFSIGSGVAISVGLFVCAPIMPYIFGHEYAAAIGAIRWLALIPLLRSLHNIAANTLTGAGHQGIRSAVQIGVAVANVLLNLWLIPRYSWVGAAWASLIADGALALVLWPIVWAIYRRARHTDGATPAQPSAAWAGVAAREGGAPDGVGDSPVVSIIVNNYNYGPYLKETIDSALRQTYPKTEVVVVDDGSTDASRAIITSYGDRIVAVLKENGGQSSAFNAGFARCRGDIVIFLDADDILLPHIVEQVAQVFQAQPAVAKVQYRLAVIDAEGTPVGLLKPAAHVPLPSGDLRQRVIRNFDDLPWQSTSGNAFAAWVLRQIFPVPEQAYPPPTGADYYVVHVATLFGTVVSLDEVGGYYRMHGLNNHHHSQMQLDRSYDIIRWIGVTHTYIQHYAKALGLAPSCAPYPPSVRLAAHRMASYKLDPLNHPIEGERLLRLFWRGVKASYRRDDLSPPVRLLFMIWFLAMLVAPKPLARWLAGKLFFPETRRQFTRLLRVFQRAQKLAPATR
jgi:O-antigen/teichoic acid export membrane protein/CTP:molybdopterin cytidylyltransferase MocA